MRLIEICTFLFTLLLFFSSPGSLQCQEIKIDKSSCESAQKTIFKVSNVIADYPSNKQLYRREVFAENFEDEAARIEAWEKSSYPEETMKWEVNLLLGIMDWTESVVIFHSAKNQGSTQKNRKKYFDQVYEYEQKQNFINYICPDITFPGFDFWDSVIKKKN